LKPIDCVGFSEFSIEELHRQENARAAAMFEVADIAYLKRQADDSDKSVIAEKFRELTYNCVPVAMIADRIRCGLDSETAFQLAVIELAEENERLRAMVFAAAKRFPFP
jgi:hypothetical protein